MPTINGKNICETQITASQNNEAKENEVTPYSPFEGHGSRGVSRRVCVSVSDGKRRRPTFSVLISQPTKSGNRGLKKKLPVRSKAKTILVTPL
jgi:hypothetical protein